MKFFSNDAKENSDEPYGRDHSDVVTSDPVAVPQQRAGSPWSDAPATTETDAPRSEDASPRSDSPRSDSPEDASPGSPSAVDAETGSPDDALAERERRDGTDEDRTDEDRTDEDGTDEGGEEPASRRDETDTLTTYHPDGTVETEDRADESAEDAAVKDEGTFDSPRAVEPATGEPLTSDAGEPGSGEPGSGEPGSGEPGSDPAVRRDVEEAPVAVTDETATDRAGAGDTVGGRHEAVAEETPVAAAPGSAPAPALDRLFTDGDSFAERFRDIQLRFVDSPKEATADAAALVGEAVDKLTGALKAQKDALGGDSEDTEQLRVQLRSYRDLLNRLSAL